MKTAIFVAKCVWTLVFGFFALLFILAGLDGILFKGNWDIGVGIILIILGAAIVAVAIGPWDGAE